MSTMSLLETNARYSIAISILNSFRHWLGDRNEADFTSEDKEIFLESVDMNQSNKLSPKMILYSFQGFTNSEHSAAIELSEALSEALKVTFDTNDQENYLKRLKDVLESMDKSSIDSNEKRKYYQAYYKYYANNK